MTAETQDTRLIFPNPLDIVAALSPEAKLRTTPENIADVMLALAAAGMRNVVTAEQAQPCTRDAGFQKALAGVAAAAQAATPGDWFVRKRESRTGELLDCFVSAPDCSGMPYDAEILGDDEYRESVSRKLADCELIVNSVNLFRAMLSGGRPELAQEVSPLADPLATGVVVDWELESEDPVAAMDAIYETYRKTHGKPKPDAEMALLMEKTRLMLFDWWAAHREAIRGALVAAAPSNKAQGPAQANTQGAAAGVAAAQEEAERCAFEAWARTRDGLQHKLDRIDGSYVWSSALWAFDMWKTLKKQLASTPVNP